MQTKSERKWILIIVTVVIIGTAIAAGIIFYLDMGAVKLRKQLDLGQKYLSEMNYEEAVLAFNQAIEIEPKSVDAYLGLADAYLGLEDTDAALEALEKGCEATGDERLQKRLDEIKESLEPAAVDDSAEREEISDSAVEAPEFTGNLEEIEEIIWDTTRRFSGNEGEHLLTYEQLESAFRPLAEQLEVYLAGHQDDADAWECLARTYLHLGEMELCLETRQKAYDITGYSWIAPEVWTNDNNGTTYDEYGRIIAESDISGTTTYGEADRPAVWEYENEQGTFRHEYEYDEWGRTAKITTIYEDGHKGYEEFAYSGNNSVVIKTYHMFTEDIQAATVIYDEYGRQTNKDPSYDWELNFEPIETPTE